MLGDGQFGAVTHEGFIDPARFGGPDVLFQPGHQWQVVGQAAKQGHGGMAVGVDQAGAEEHVRELAHFLGGVLERRGPWRDQGDTAVANAQAVILEDHAGGFDRHQPGGQEQEVERGAGVGHVG